MAQPERVEGQHAPGEHSAPLKINLDSFITIEAIHLYIFEVAQQHGPQVAGLKEVEVIRVLKIGRRVGRDDACSSRITEHPGDFGDVRLGINEVLDEM